MRSLMILLIVINVNCSKQTVELTQKPPIHTDLSLLQEEEVRLAEPMVKIDSLIFKESAQVDLSFGLAGTKILYTLDTDPQKEYSTPITVSKSCKLKVQTTMEGYKPSHIRTIQFVKVSDKLNGAKVEVSPSPSDNYPGNGASTLIDMQKGNYSFRDGQKWLGFQEKTVTIDIELTEETEFSKVYVSFLTDHSAWIFEPRELRVSVDGTRQLVDKGNVALKAEAASLNLHPLKFDSSVRGRKLSIEIESLGQIPGWHQGAGTTPWLFIDEIIVE